MDIAINDQFRLTRVQRILASEDFGKVINNAVFKKTSKTLTVLAIKNQHLYARLGVIVGKKKVRKAHRRNTVRRIIRESFRHHQGSLIGLDIVVIAKSEIDTLTKLDIRECIDNLWKNLFIQLKKQA